MQKTITIDIEEESYNRGYEDGKEERLDSYKFSFGGMCFLVGFLIGMFLLYFAYQI